MVKEQSDTTKRLNFFEILVFIAILLVTVFTFFEDFAILTGLDGRIQTILMLIGFGFDFFFTVEFLSRLYYSRFDRGMAHYFIHEYGWVDFLASVPLIMFNSGPHTALYFLSATGLMDLEITATFLTLLKLIKIIRIARVLRLLRVLKIFKLIKYTDTRMAQRHITKIITIGVTIVVFILFSATIALEYTNLRRLYDPSYDKKSATLDFIEKKLSAQKDLVAGLKSLDAIHNVLLIVKNSKTIYARTTKADIDSLPIHDYDIFSRNGLEVYFDIRAENETFAKNTAKDFLIFYFIILSLIIGFLILYSPHFTLTITDPVKIMKRGMAEQDYNLEVKIPARFESDEVYELARQYNDKFLPMKDRNKDSSGEYEADISKEDLDDVFDTDSDDEK